MRQVWILFLVPHLNCINCWNESDWWAIHANISACDAISCKSKDDLKWQSEQIMDRWANCRCDENCRQYADCCYDSRRFSLPEQFNSSSTFKCVDVVDTGVYMIAGCPLDWKDTEIEKACRDESWKDPLLALPVTSESNYVTYKNMHCAICNNVTNFTVWDIDFIYVPYDDYDVLPDEYVKDNIFYNCNTSSWGFQYEDFIEVTLYPKMMKKFKPYIRQCRPEVIDDCRANDTVVRENTKKLCRSYTFVVYDQNGRAYRNPYCALCNNVSTENLNCWKAYHKVDAIEITSTLTESINYYTTSPLCDTKQVYDVFTKTCRNIQIIIKCLESYRYPSEVCSINKNPQVQKCENFLNRRDQNLTNDDGITIKVTNKSLPSKNVNISENKENISCNQIHGINPFYQTDYIDKTISFVSYILSIFFLTLHMVHFIRSPSIYKLAGKNNISFSTTLIMSYITLLSGNYFVGVGHYFMSVALLYSLLASFTWMVVISYDIYRMVTSTRVQSQASSKRFLCYSCWGWLVPAFMAGVAVFAELSSLVRDDWKPAIGLSSCWFGQNKPWLAFFVAPLITFMLLCAILFTRGAITIYIVKTGVHKFSEHSFKLYLRVALAMGLTWIVGLLSMSINDIFLHYTFVILNSFQGFIVFLSFLDPDVTKSMKAKFFGRFSEKCYVYYKFNNNGHQ